MSSQCSTQSFESAVRLCEAVNGGVFRLDGSLIHAAALHGMNPHTLTPFGGCGPAPRTEAPPSAGRSSHARVVHVDIAEDPEYEQSVLGQAGFRIALSVPMLRDGTPIGAITRIREEGTAVLAQADRAARDLRGSGRHRDRERAAVQGARGAEPRSHRDARAADGDGEILRVISSSPTDFQPVFDIIAANALKLCDAHVNAVTLYDGELLHLVALANVNPEGAEALRQAYPRRADSGHGGGRAVSTRAVVQIPDVLTDRAYELKSEQQAAGYRSVLAVPMLRDGEPIGAISLGRREPRPFSDKQIALVKTFADQAVIAIENVRLFRELRARTAELTRSVEQLTALGEVSRAVSSTLDVETVLKTIVTRANQLAGTDGCLIYEYDELTRSSDCARAATRIAHDAAAPAALGGRHRFPRGRD